MTTQTPNRVTSLLAIALASVVIFNSVCLAGEPADAGEVLQAVRARYRAPALAGAVLRDGQLVALGVSGVRRLDESTPATLDDLWPIGSCTKPMTRFVVGRLAERGVVHLDATLDELFTGAPMQAAYKRATLRDLLAHRAGIQPYTDIGPRLTPVLFELKGTPTEQRAAFAAHVLSEEPVAEPTTRMVYSNAGFCLVAAALERKTGKSWEELVQAELFGPLELSSAGIGAAVAAERVPWGHLHPAEGYEPARRAWSMLGAMVPAGGVALSVKDFGKFAAAQADLQAGRPVAGISSGVARQIAEAGPGGPIFGGDGRYTAAFAVWPEQRVAIAVASNAGESDELCAAAIEALRATYAADVSAGPDAAADAGKGPRFGFMLMNLNDTVSVAKVVPGSIAAKAGLREGDAIVAVDGQPAGKLSEADWSGLSQRKQVKLTVERDGQRVEVALDKGP